MKPLLPLIIFWLFGALAILGAIAVAILPNLIRSAFALFLSLLSIAAIYLLAGADFLAYTQIIIYVGAILILLLFGIMLTKRTLEEPAEGGFKNQLSGGFVCLMILVALIAVMFTAESSPLYTPTENSNPISTGISEAIGVQTLTRYLLPFEVVSLLLLAALIGAAWLTRRNSSTQNNTHS